MHRAPKLALILSFFAMLLLSRAARAEDMIIKNPGDHPRYSVEIEPHLAFTFFDLSDRASGFGPGARFSIPIVKNGFVKSINDSVAIGFGVDWMRYNGCYRSNWYYNGACDNANALFFPVVMQWNFFLSTHWSVFGEPGLAISHTSWGGTCYDRGAGNTIVAVDCGSRNDINPVFFAGGRYHFSESVALTMRIGTPYFSVGVSFM